MPVKIVSPELSLCMERYETVLRTNPIYTPEDIRFAKRVFCEMELSLQEMTWMLLFLAKTTTTGRYARNFHTNIQKEIQNRDRTAIQKNYSHPDLSMFIEINNKDLTQSEKQKIQEIITREYEAMNQAIQLHMNQSDIPILDCSSGKCRYTSGNINASSLYTACYTRMCLEQGIMSSSTIPENLVWIDINENGTRQIYQIQLEKLLNIMKTDSINPFTRKPFSKSLKKSIQDKYSLELKILS